MGPVKRGSWKMSSLLLKRTKLHSHHTSAVLCQISHPCLQAARSVRRAEKQPTPQQLRIGWPSSSNQHDEAHTGSAAAAAVQHPTIGLGGGSGCGGGSNTAKRWGGEGGGGDDLGRPSRPAWQQLLAMLTAVLLPATLLLPAPAQAATAASKRSGFVSQQDERNFMSSWQLDAFVDRMWDLSGPILNNIGFSGLLGACTAAALKWVGRTLAASVGIGLVLVQVLSYYNVITVNWSVVHKQARQVLDSTGDGRLDQDDFKRVVKQGLVVLSEGVPSLSGFLVGFLVGMKVF